MRLVCRKQRPSVLQRCKRHFTPVDFRSVYFNYIPYIRSGLQKTILELVNRDQRRAFKLLANANIISYIDSFEQFGYSLAALGRLIKPILFQLNLCSAGLRIIVIIRPLAAQLNCGAVSLRVSVLAAVTSVVSRRIFTNISPPFLFPSDLYLQTKNILCILKETSPEHKSRKSNILLQKFPRCWFIIKKKRSNGDTSYIAVIFWFLYLLMVEMDHQQR